MSDSRLEKFIYAICSMDVSDLPVPLSRIEKLWNCLITGETPYFEPLSRNEKYLMAMLDRYDISNLPAPMSRGEKLLYKIAVGETNLSDVPGYLSRYEELLKYLIENGGISGGDFKYILQTLNQRLSTLYSTKEQPMKQAVIKGDTLVNELPKPSLKNAMTNVASQKLNQGYDAVNAVDGEFKSAILSGCTLVNVNRSNFIAKSNITTDYANAIPLFDTNMKASTTYTVITYSDNQYEYRLSEIRNTTNEVALNNGYPLTVGVPTVFTTNENFTSLRGYLKGNTLNIPQGTEIKILIIEGDHSNENIPYFEGMQSVQLSEVKIENNLFNGKIEPGVYSIVTGETDANDFNRIRCVDFIPIDDSSDTTFKIYNAKRIDDIWILQYDKDKQYLGSPFSINKDIYETRLNLRNDCAFIKFYEVGVTEGVNTNRNYVITDKSNTLTLAEPVNLRKVGDVEDTFDALTGQVTERVGEVVLDGVNISPIPNYMSRQNNTIGFDFKKSFQSLDSAFIRSLNDTFPDYNGQYLYDNDIEGVARGWDAISVRINKNRLTQENVEGFIQWLQSNPITVQYELATPTTKTIIPTITDQDGVIQTKLHSFNDGYLSVSSQGLLPSAVNYEVPTNNSYYLPDMLTLGAQYTSRGSADCAATIDGRLLALGANRTFTTPSSVTDKLMVLDAPVDDLMFIKGDQTAKDFGYFEGMKSVVLSNKMPVLTTVGKNLFPNIKFIHNRVLQQVSGNIANVTTDDWACEDYLNVPQQKTLYTNMLYIGLGWTKICFYDENKKFISSRMSNDTVIFPENSKYWRVGAFVTPENSHLLNQIMLCDSMEEARSAYEPYKSNILTVNEDLTLRSNGNVYDELDLLTGKLTQRIDEDGSVLTQEVVKTVDLTTVDQDGQPTALKTFNDISYVEMNADNIIPSVDVEVATKISEILATLDPQQLDISNNQNKLGQTINEQTENTDAAMLATTEIYENL